MQIYCDEVVQQSEQARVNINGRKTKEMLIGSISKDPPPHLMLFAATFHGVTTFKLFGVHVSSNLKWTDHVDAMISNAASRLHFLKHAAESSGRSNPRFAALLRSDSPAGS